MAADDIIKVSSDYAEAKGLLVDDKMGTAAYWLQDMKDVTSGGAAIDDSTAAQISADEMTFRYYVTSRGEIAYTQSIKTTVGTLPVLLLDTIVNN